MLRLRRKAKEEGLVASIPTPEWESLMGHEQDFLFLLDDRLEGRMNLAQFQQRLGAQRTLLVSRVNDGWFKAERQQKRLP